MSRVFVLASGAPLEEVPPPAGLEIVLDLDRRRVEYRNAGVGFAVYRTERIPEVQTEKPCFSGLDLYGPGHEEALAAYLRTQAEAAGDVELWHLWLDGGFDHRVRMAEIPAAELTAADFRELEALEVSRRDPVLEVPTDYCYQIKK